MHYPEKTHRVDKIESSHRDSMKLRNAEFIIKISGTESGRDFTFVLKGAHLQVIPGNEVPKKGGGSVSEDWYEALTEEERLDVMQAVCAHYRKASRDPDGVKTASIGIVNNPDERCHRRDKHLIYVGINNHLNTDENSKGCAEQGMVKAASNSTTQFMYHSRDKELPDTPFIKEVFVMGGRAPNPAVPGDRGMGAICPCGQCTDLLARTMVPGGHVYVLPPTKGFETLLINDSSRNFSDVVPGVVWKTTIDNLNRHRVIMYGDGSFEKKAQKDGFKAAVSLLKDFSLPEVLDEVANQERENSKRRRKSIAELDMATHDGKLDPQAVSRFMYNEIMANLDDRLQSNNVASSEEAITDWLQKKVKYVRSVVIQLDDGTYRCGLDSRTGSDKAFVNAEFTALGAGASKLGTLGVKHLWTMEFNPEAIAHGVMVTSTKDGLERIYKRHTKIPGQQIQVSNIPFNNQCLAKDDLETMVRANSFAFPEVFPSLFAGNGLTGGPPKPVAGPFQKFLYRSANVGGMGL